MGECEGIKCFPSSAESQKERSYPFLTHWPIERPKQRCSEGMLTELLSNGPGRIRNMNQPLRTDLQELLVTQLLPNSRTLLFS